jgi:hypothetical protein
MTAQNCALLRAPPSTRLTPVGGEMSRSTTDILDLAAHLRGFERQLRAANRAPATIAKYTLTARQLIAFLASCGPGGPTLTEQNCGWASKGR